jgi:hypothetical protein
VELLVELQFYTEKRQSGQTLGSPDRRAKKKPLLEAGVGKMFIREIEL